jgi:hypothetical protein
MTDVGGQKETPRLALDMCWEVRLYVSSNHRRHTVLGATTRHPTEHDARQRAQYDLALLRDYDQRRPYHVADICYVATVQNIDTRITGYLLDHMQSIDWDEVPEVLDHH